MPYREGVIAAMKNIVLFSLVSVFFPCLFFGSLLVAGPENSYAQKDWKQEYAEVCGGTQDAMGYTVEELKSFVERCDKLRDRINQPDGLQTPTEKKVYGKRLKMCRDLYDFALQHKELKK